MRYQYTFTRLLVEDFRACYLFYRDVLGFQPSFGTENDGYADFDTGGVTIALFDRREMSETVGTSHLPPQAAAQDGVCLVFAVEDVAAACRHLQSHGIPLTTPMTDHPDWGIRTAHFRDPDGNLIEINCSLEIEPGSHAQ